MTVSIAISGKGGTGKTTIAALLIRILWEKTGKVVLAIDADPNSNLNESLGVKVKRTVGDIREALLRDKDTLSPEQTKEDYLNSMIQSSISEHEGFDLLVMGRPEGPGCYCYVNNLLRKIVDSLSDNYSFVVMDAEAGLEHFSRRTTKDVDILLIVTDPTARGLATARRIRDLVSELHTKVGRLYLVANRVPPGMNSTIQGEMERTGINTAGIIPEDPLIQELDIRGRPFTELPEDSPACRAMDAMVEKLALTKMVAGVASVRSQVR